MLNEYVWSSFVKASDVKNLPEAEILQMVTELMVAVQSICYSHGVHN